MVRSVLAEALREPDVRAVGLEHARHRIRRTRERPPLARGVEQHLPGICERERGACAYLAVSVVVEAARVGTGAGRPVRIGDLTFAYRVRGDVKEADDRSVLDLLVAVEPAAAERWGARDVRRVHLAVL